MTTSFSDFIESISENLSVSGVKRFYVNPPASVNAADLPCAFPYGFRRTQTPLTFQAHGGWPETQVDYVILVEAVGANTQPANYAKVIEMADNLDQAIASTDVGSIGKGIVTWSIQAGNQQVNIADIAYWAVVATITGNG